MTPGSPVARTGTSSTSGVGSGPGRRSTVSMSHVGQTMTSQENSSSHFGQNTWSSISFDAWRLGVTWRRCRARRDGTVENVPARTETCFLKRAARCDISRIATRRRNVPACVADALQLLYEERTETSPAKRLGYIHVYVTVRPVVMEKNATGRCYRAFDFHNAVPLQLPVGNARDVRR